MTANTIHDILLTHIDLKSKYEYVHGRRDYTRTKMPVSSIQQTRDIWNERKGVGIMLQRLTSYMRENVSFF